MYETDVLPLLSVTEAKQALLSEKRNFANHVGVTKMLGLGVWF